MCAALAALAAGCSAGHRADSGLDARIRQGARKGSTQTNPDENVHPTLKAQRTGASQVSNSGNTETIATIDGVPIPRHRIVDLLLASHGVGVLEQVIGLEAARTLARERGLVVTTSDFDTERSRSLKRLTDPLASVTPDSVDKAESERVLQRILSERNISESEFNLVLERNAILRKIVESQIAFSEYQLRDELERTYGERVRVRHIQLATSGEIARLRERLHKGEDFPDLAIRYSANRASAERGGLLEPFSQNDDRLPFAFREAAFGLSVGDVSDPIRIGEWYHILRLEQRLPAEPQDIESVRPELEARLRERLVEPAMFDLYEKLFQQATIRIHDPVLREAFERKHPGRLR
jgi:foldase protein PrsA